MAWDEDRTARVFAPYAGRVERIRVSLGQSVKKGQPLADVSSSDIGQAQADLHKAEADRAVAQAAVERSRELAEAGVIANKELQQSVADLARNTAELGRARARLQQYGISASAVTQGLALVAPLDATVVERNVNGKAEVRSDVQGQPLFTLSDPSSLWAILDVDETDLAAFRVGQPLELRATAWPERRFPGTVTSIGEAVDPNSRTVKVRAKVDNAERLLKAEMFVSAQVSRASQTATVPADAVLLQGERLYVFVQVAPGRFERRPVQARSAGPQRWLVDQGVVAGDKVVIGGALYLEQMIDTAR
ncbi:MAG: efflux RND transporter periplasmic adaptor subunit [Pseudomonadota bacterium]|nr:efflux RND transporter periplasmic adaptor subunit [Pseudomonadota bacterium]